MGWPGCGPPGGWCPAAPGGMAPMGGATVLGGGPPPLDMGGGGGPAAAGSPGVVPGAPGAGGAMKEVDMTLWLATRPGEGDTASVLDTFFPNCLFFCSFVLFFQLVPFLSACCVLSLSPLLPPSAISALFRRHSSPSLLAALSAGEDSNSAREKQSGFPES